MDRQVPDMLQTAVPDSGMTITDMNQIPEEPTDSPAFSENGSLPDAPAGKNISGRETDAKDTADSGGDGRAASDAAPEDEDASRPDAGGKSSSGASSSARRSRRQKSRTSKAPETPPAQVSAASWFVTLMCMNIPVIGWLYLIILAFSKSAGARRGFARAYLLYKFIFLLITLAILAVAVHYGMIYLDMLLSYMEML